MSTAMHEPHPTIRVGRSVSVSSEVRANSDRHEGQEPLSPQGLTRYACWYSSVLSAMASPSLVWPWLVFFCCPETGSENNVAAASPLVLVCLCGGCPAIQPIAMFARSRR